MTTLAASMPPSPPRSARLAISTLEEEQEKHWSMPVVAGKVREPSSIPRSLCHFERTMGDTEASYFLPSRENGVNDMYDFSSSMFEFL